MQLHCVAALRSASPYRHITPNMQPAPHDAQERTAAVQARWSTPLSFQNLPLSCCQALTRRQTAAAVSLWQTPHSPARYRHAAHTREMSRPKSLVHTQPSPLLQPAASHSHTSLLHARDVAPEELGAHPVTDDQQLVAQADLRKGLIALPHDASPCAKDRAHFWDVHHGLVTTNIRQRAFVVVPAGSFIRVQAGCRRCRVQGFGFKQGPRMPARSCGCTCRAWWWRWV